MYTATDGVLCGKYNDNAHVKTTEFSVVSTLPPTRKKCTHKTVRKEQISPKCVLKATSEFSDGHNGRVKIYELTFKCRMRRTCIDTRVYLIGDKYRQ